MDERVQLPDTLVDEAVCKCGGAGTDAPVSPPNRLKRLCAGWLASLTIIDAFM